MATFSNDCDDQVNEIASSLADNFVRQLYDFYNEKSYSAYLKSMSEIYHWAHEFYIQYNYKLNDWESFKESPENSYQAISKEGFLIAWGKNRMKVFLELKEYTHYN